MAIDTERDQFITQCVDYETTFQTVLLRSAGLFEVTTHFKVPPELKVRAEEAIAQVLKTSRISAKQRAVFKELVEIKLLEFESAYRKLIEAKGGEHSGFMPLEKDIMGQLLMHLLLEHFLRHVGGKRREDFLFLFADQQSEFTTDRKE